MFMRRLPSETDYHSAAYTPSEMNWLDLEVVVLVVVAGQSVEAPTGHQFQSTHTLIGFAV